MRVDAGAVVSGPRTGECCPAVKGKSLAALFREVEARLGLPRGLVEAVARVESGLNPRAVSPAGALGLMQLMPATARALGANDPFDPAQNVEAGARYLRHLLDRFGGNLRLALAAYNAGPGAVERYGGVPPYSETRTYVEKVLALMPGRKAGPQTVPIVGAGPDASGTGGAEIPVAALRAYVTMTLLRAALGAMAETGERERWA